MILLLVMNRRNGSNGWTIVILLLLADCRNSYDGWTIAILLPLIDRRLRRQQNTDSGLV